MLSSQRSVVVCVCVLGGAALGEVGVEDGCRHGDHHCDDRHPGAPAALSERRDDNKHRRKTWTKKIRSVCVVMSELLDSNWSKEWSQEGDRNKDEEEQRERRWRGLKKTNKTSPGPKDYIFSFVVKKVLGNWEILSKRWHTYLFSLLGS